MGFAILMMIAHVRLRIKTAINVKEKDIMVVFAHIRKISATKDLKGEHMLNQNKGLKVSKKESMPMS